MRGGITQARQRLGHEPLRELFAQVAVPVADADTEGAFLGPWRLMTIDGFEWDVPDTKENAGEFGYAGTGGDAEGGAGFPKARVVTIGECASHAQVLAAIGPVTSKGSGEQSLARRVYPRLEEDWLLIADRNFYNWADWCTAADTRAALLWRGEYGHPPPGRGGPARRPPPAGRGRPHNHRPRRGQRGRGPPAPGGTARGTHPP